MTPIIEVEGLGKRYRIGESVPYRTLREGLVGAVGASCRLIREAMRHHGSETNRGKPQIWALRDINFEVMPGEVLGVIGRNGAGKSTLLKILSRITEPTEGRARLRGRVGSLLEVGTGFHSELTGRENIYLNGAILGMRRAEIARKFDEIVNFAEVEKFIDTPVKHYSSGMYVRLAFAVAAHLSTEILLVDEVLAVGDAAFWSKAIARMRSLNQQGTTILLVTHNMWLVQTACSRVMLLDGGKVVEQGLPLRITGLYRQAADTPSKGGAPLENGGHTESRAVPRITRLETFPLSDLSSPVEELSSNSGLKIVMSVDAPTMEALKLLVRFNSPDGLPYFTVYSDLIEVPDTGRLQCEAVIPHIMLAPGDYRVWASVCTDLGEEGILATESLPLVVASDGAYPSFNLMWNEALWTFHEPTHVSGYEEYPSE
jgi:lipopolysaccharide transport system ATP-binding protein